MVCRRKLRHQTFYGLTDKHRAAILMIFQGGNRAYPDLHPKVRHELLVFRYIHQNTKTGVVTITSEGRLAATAILAQS